MTCPFKTYTLSKLPKGSSCREWKRAPATSAYWRDDTDSVERCAEWATSGDGDGTAPPDDEGPPDGGDDGGDDIPGKVGWYERVDPERAEDAIEPTWDIEVAWHYDGGRPGDHPGEVWAYIEDSGEDSRTGRYKFKAKGDQMGTRRSGPYTDDLGESVEHAVGWMNDHDPTVPTPEFDVTIPNAIMKPLTKTANRMGHGAKLVFEDAQETRGGFRVLRVIGGGGLSMYRASIPEESVDGDLPDTDGVLSVSLNHVYRVCNDAKKSSDVRLWTDTDGPLDHLKVSAEGHTGSDEYKRSIASNAPDYPMLGAPDAMVTTTGRNYRQAIKSLSVLAHRDSDPVAVVADESEDSARVVLETDYQHGEERARAPLDMVDDEPFKIMGDGATGVQFQFLDESSKSIPRPASTAVDLRIYEEGNEQADVPTLSAGYVDEGVNFSHALRAGEDVDEYDLSEPIERCFPERGEYELHEPLQSGEPVPDIEGMDLENGDSVVWTFPNADGCRCGAQAMQYDQLAEETDTDVYAIAASPPEELQEMAERYDLDITLVSDPDGTLADEFGVEMQEDGTLERRTFFVREGQVTDVSDGVASAALAEPDRDGECPFRDRYELQEPDSDLYENLKHPGVYVITGKRGSGKSAAAFRIGEKVAENQEIKKVTVGTPEGVREAFPGDWLHVEQLQDAPLHSVVVIDESYMKYNARTPLADDNQSLGPLVNTSRHCQQSILFVTQNSALLDKTAVGEADGLLIKKPGALHSKFERRPIRELTEEAESAFGQLPDSLEHRRFGYLYTDDHQGLVENDKPEWYDDTVSRSFAGACGQAASGDDD